MNILFLAHRIPYPPNKGDKIRSFNEIKYLSKNNNIFLGTILDNKSDMEVLNELKRYCKESYFVYFNKRISALRSLFSRKPFSISNFYNSRLQEYVDEILENENIDTVICFCSVMAEYIFKSRLYKEKDLDDIRLIMDFVDLDSDKWLQYAKYTRFPLNLLYKLENKRLFKYEIRINKIFDISIFVSQREVHVFKELYHEARNLHIIPNGVDYNYFLSKQINSSSQPAIRNPQTAIIKKQPVLIFTGIMDYFANEDGVNWFCKHIFPKIKAEIPDVQFYIVGNYPTKKVMSLSMIDGVIVTGYVEDIREYYMMADICVVPLRIARGLQNKVLESMSTGNAVVATSNASNGITSHDSIDIVIADDVESFAKKTISLLKNENRRKELGKKAVENILKNYSWDTNLKAFDNLL
jgi:sugar transferase, PEP-CTERM/EpsH1 system associated